jgi:hypothetical protein
MAALGDHRGPWRRVEAKPKPKPMNYDFSGSAPSQVHIEGMIYTINNMKLLHFMP